MNTLFMAAMIIEAVFALGFIAIPGVMMGQFGVVLNDAAAVFARLFGSALLSLPVLLWFGRRSTRPEFKTAVARVLFMYYLPSTPILLLTQTAGLMNARGWSIIALHLVFLVWFGVYAFKKN
ncbi:MAG: hypothetical protein E4H23_08005 [Chrysiogenales bacterium]|nr:hypothetical protein [Candidatus Aminicenantes bacterium]TFG78283.1 MAG: hypothetical protein E4H23_08005 [Chrysiogenales bacterium]